MRRKRVWGLLFVLLLAFIVMACSDAGNRGGSEPSSSYREPTRRPPTSTPESGWFGWGDPTPAPVHDDNDDDGGGGGYYYDPTPDNSGGDYGDNDGGGGGYADPTPDNDVSIFD
jgi:hypothetical protein